ncbi:MAG: hypothetical protein IPI21_17920 [Propionivibrio sp.]|nr:hypothetical protein [Propionivibrio sp.]
MPCAIPWRAVFVERGSSPLGVADLLRHLLAEQHLIYAKLDTPKSSGRLAMARECSMSAHTSLQQRIDEHLTATSTSRFRIAFVGYVLTGFAGYVVDRKHREPLTADP